VPSGTCTTGICHNNGTAQSAAWNGTALACNACHYWSGSPTGSGNTGYVPPLSGSHNDHFDHGKTCTQCHGAVPTSTAHISGSTSTMDAANALQDEAGLAIVSGATTYSWDDAGNSCTPTANNGLGCHATGAPD